MSGGTAEDLDSQRDCLEESLTGWRDSFFEKNVVYTERDSHIRHRGEWPLSRNAQFESGK